MTTDLHAFRDPRCVALVGASADPMKWGNWYAPGLLAGRHRREVVLVNERGITIDGVESVRNLHEAPVAPELVVICVPPAAVPAAIDESLAVGATGLLVITAGIDQVLGAGAEQQLAERVRAAGARLIGPNCVGLVDNSTELHVQWLDRTPGALAVVSQSGRVALDAAAAAAACGLGISRFVSLGNQIDVDAADMLTDLIDHEPTRVVALYAESFGDGRRVVEAIARLHDSGRRTVVLTVGASAAASAAARSHTGSLTSSMDVVEAACRAAGAIRVQSPQQLIDAVRMLAAPHLPRGRRIAIVGDSGGGGAIGADLAAAAGLEVPPFPAATQTALAAQLEYNASVVNPIDLGGAGAIDYADFARIVDASATSGAVDMVLLTSHYGAYSLDYPETTDDEVAVAHDICAIANTHRVPVVVHCSAADSPTLRALGAGGVTTHTSVERAISAAAAAANAATRHPRPLQAGPDRVDPSALADLTDPRALLGAVGVTFPTSMVVHDHAAAVAAAGALRPPLALKADWIEHKTEVGGVVLGLADATAVGAAVEAMSARLGPGPYRVEEMDTRPHVVEVLVGMQRDPAFGPVVTVGAGGAFAELLRDTTMELAPLDEDTAIEMLGRLRCQALLDGWRGAPAVDIAALARVIVAVGDLAVARPDLAEIELNPVRVGPTGAMAVDVLVVH